MPPIYVTEQGAKLRVRNNCLLVEKEGENEPELLYRAPIGTVSQVVLLGNIGMTTPSIAEFLQREIDVVFLDHLGNYRGRLMSGADPHASLRRAQYAAAENESFAHSLRFSLIRAKLRHQRALLRRHDPNDGTVSEAIENIASAEIRLEKKKTADEQRGEEGIAAKAYFAGYRRFFAEEWGFRARLHHPSPDPVNAMLSFGYTLLAGIADSAVQTVGLDPFVGFLHREGYNRSSLGLDLMEEFRPVVDGVVLRCVHEELITPADFSKEPGNAGCRMTNEARKTFLREFETRMQGRYTHPVTQTRLPMRQCILEQARQIAAACEKAPELPRFVCMGFR